MPSTATSPHLVSVNLGSRSYTVQVGHGLLSSIGDRVRDTLPGRTKCAVLTDSNVEPLYGSAILESLRKAGQKVHLITVPAGEASKSLRCSETVLSQMAAAGLDRKSFLIALGGGVIGDLGGFCAAIYQRGIPYIQVPTTVLAQVDSSVGGKTGVNLPDAKNMVGCFHQPTGVIADTDTLQSLPRREWNEGFAEIIKHAAIRDAALFHDIRAAADRASQLDSLIKENVAIKAAIVEADEFEVSGLRALLNFGHTLGHAIEAAAGYGRLLHGEAISLGLRAAGWLSTQLSGLPEADYAQLIAALRLFDLPTELPDDITTPAIMRVVQMDKKFENGAIRFVLLRRLGDAFLSQEVRVEHLEQAIAAIRC